MPAIYQSREYGAAGGLISYGASFAAAFRSVGIYAGKILKGAKPTDLPVEQATVFELVINLSAAKSDMNVPPCGISRFRHFPMDDPSGHAFIIVNASAERCEVFTR